MTSAGHGGLDNGPRRVVGFVCAGVISSKHEIFVPTAKPES